MNWKINYWTLLFAVAVLGLAYQRYAGGQDQKPETGNQRQNISCPETEHYSIPDSVADLRTQRYKQLYAPQVQQFASDSCNTLNGGVWYFGVKQCEMLAMAESFNEADSIYAMMSLQPGSGGAKDTLDLIFKVFTATGPLTHQYYDFTNPCPPCGGN